MQYILPQKYEDWEFPEKANMKKAAIRTLGCRVNQLESSIISDKLKENGWQVVKFNDFADIYIINSCTVTQKSDNESRYYARKAKKINPAAQVILCGCYAQVSAVEASQFEEIDFVAGNTEKLELINIIENLNSLDKQNKICVSDIMQQEKFADKTVFSASGRTRANIKIQDGCNHRCSYCIIPFARGKSRSNNLENVLSQINELTQKGFQEIVLTGIHLGQWGLDLEPKSSLTDLLLEIEKIESLKRYRLSSIDPLECTDDFVEAIKNSKKFCRHLHISLQNGNDEILKAMRRRYTVEYYSELMQKLVANIPDIAIGSDIIVGFPSETEEHFEDTCKNLENLPISYIHVFSYSKRKGTPASLMENQVKEDIKKARNAKLTEIAKRKNLEFRRRFLGKELEVMVELSGDKKTGFLKGVTDNFIPVLIDASDEYKNKLVKVRIKEVSQDITIGEIV